MSRYAGSDSDTYPDSEVLRNKADLRDQHALDAFEADATALRMLELIEQPTGWASTQLRSILTQIVGGGTPSKINTAFFTGSIPFMTVKDLYGRFPSDTIDHISEAAVSSSATTLVPADTLIIATRMSLGKIARPTVSVAINQDLKALFLADGIDKTYVEHYWRSKAGHIQELGTGTTVKGIRLDDIRELEIPLAPLPEQKRIADKLDTVLARVDACRDRLDRLPALLKRFRQSILAAATSGRLTEDWRLTHAQNEWLEEPLGELIVDGPQNGLYKHSSAYGTGTGILRIDMFYDGEVTGWNAMKLLDVTQFELKTYGLSVGDIVVNRVNSPPYVGKAALIRELPQSCVFESNMMRIQLDTTRILPEYCIRFLSSLQGLAQLRRNVKHAVNQASINQTDVKSVNVPLPSIEEQHEIVRRVEILFAFADRLEARLATARKQVAQLTPALLAKAFRGELVPQDPADEPASELLKRLAAQREATPPAKGCRRKA